MTKKAQEEKEEFQRRAGRRLAKKRRAIEEQKTESNEERSNTEEKTWDNRDCEEEKHVFVPQQMVTARSAAESKVRKVYLCAIVLSY